jgi:hypothetical protein
MRAQIQPVPITHFYCILTLLEGIGFAHVLISPLISVCVELQRPRHRVPTPPGPPPPSLREAKARRNHLNEVSSSLIPTGIGERYSQTLSNLGHAALLRL